VWLGWYINSASEGSFTLRLGSICIILFSHFWELYPARCRPSHNLTYIFSASFLDWDVQLRTSIQVFGSPEMRNAVCNMKVISDAVLLSVL